MTDSSTALADAADGDNHGFIIVISVIATLGGFLFGFDSGVINGTVDGLQSAFQSDSAGTGFNVASMLLLGSVGTAVTLGILTAVFSGAETDVSGGLRLGETQGQVGLVGAYGFYTLSAIASIVFVLVMMHETKGVELEAMQG